jgi:RNA recognition motif-containing protein
MDVHPEQRLFVGNLPTSYRDVDLHRLFSSYGKIIEARIAVDKEYGRSKGFGFVTMGSRKSALDAKRGLTGYPLPDGRICNVEISDSGNKSSGGHKKSSGSHSSHYSHSNSHSYAAPVAPPVVTSKRKRSVWPDDDPNDRGRDNSRDR